MRTYVWEHGKRRLTHLKDGNFVFERMSPADLWNLIASAARSQLFRVPRRAFTPKKYKKKRKSKRKKEPKP